ncbi:hypothetical protein FRC08_012142 [Ceratobasidium sp. 394]|nr:hypothetical protein FRC08_012142 [Ceratobasidium sp. 394]
MNRKAQTCKRHFDIVSKSISLQLHIELEANGLQIARDLADEDKNHQTLLSKLQRYRDAWLDLDLEPPVQQHYGDEDMPLWELRGGVFVKAFNHPGTRLTFTGKPNSLRLFRLDVPDRSTQVDFSTTFSEFSLDTSQELVVLVGMGAGAVECNGWIRFRSSVTGQAHPLATHPVQTVELGFDISDTSTYDLAVEIKHDLVAVLFACSTSGERSYEVLIWNWKRGVLLNRINCDHGICRFVFLDDNRLVLWSARGTGGGNTLNSIDLLVYEQIGSSRSNRDDAGAQLVDIPSFPSLSPALTFHFPRLRDSSGIKAEGLELLSDYGPGASFAACAPFTHPNALTLGLTISVVDDGDLIPLRIFVDTGKLLGHLRRAKEKAVSTLAWEGWGENATRWFHADTPNPWIRWMFGSRFIVKNDCISVVDFHTPTVRRHAHRQRDTYVSLELSPGELQQKESCILHGRLPSALKQNDRDASSDHSDESASDTTGENDVVVDIVECNQPTSLSCFDEPVVSRLPYRIITRLRPSGQHSGWLISGNHLVGIRYSYGFGPSTNEVTIYTVAGSNETRSNL